MIARSSIFIVFALIFINAAVSPADSLNDEAYEKISEGSQLFASNLFKNAFETDPKKNLVISPISVSMLLAMMQLGARGYTRDEIKSALHSPEDSTMKNEYRNLIDSLRSADKVNLTIANRIFVNGGIELKKDFKGVTKDFFRSEAEKVDFYKGAEAVKIINDWAASQTDQKITKILNDDAVDYTTFLVLCNALYFKGSWEKKFDAKLTGNRDFRINGESVKSVPTMSMQSSFNWGYLEDLKTEWIELPYQNKDLSMIIILPDDPNGLSDLVKGLVKHKIGDIRKTGKKTDVEILLPKFKIESELSFKESLRKMGLSSMFSDSANFSGITNVDAKVDSAIQKAVIEVNEEGSVGAAASAIGIVSRNDAGSFFVEHPFVFVIQFKDIVLFQGAVVYP